MPPTPEPGPDAVAARLRAALAGLDLTVDAVSVARDDADVPSYPDGPRPSSVVALEGGRHSGRGEHVGWTAADHARFAAAAPDAVPRGRSRLGEWPAALAALPRYDRAALEAAAIDLALRQHAVGLLALAGAAPRSIRYVVSFARVADPAAEARAQGAVELKVDADPAWDEEVLRRLAAAGRVAVVDWKGGGDHAAHLRAHACFPDALVEDPAPEGRPWPASLEARLAVDAALERATDLDALPLRFVAANLKPARMGGVLELLEAASRCAAHGMTIYLGGMFEVAVGRRQLHALAAALCPDGPNDVAPIARAGAAAARPPRLPVGDAPGFGA